jgi:hypothetical protein
LRKSRRARRTLGTAEGETRKMAQGKAADEVYESMVKQVKPPKTPEKIRSMGRLTSAAVNIAKLPELLPAGAGRRHG